MTKEDRLEVVRQLREAREKWTTERQSAKNESRRVKTSQGVSSKKLGIPLNDDFFSDLES